MPVSEKFWTAKVLLICSLCVPFVLSQKVATETNIVKDGDSLLNCSELTNLAEMARCLTKRFAAAKHKTASGSYGYPFNVAPGLPPFLKHEPDHPPSANNVGRSGRRNDNGPVLERRMQGYYTPEYRNFLDLDSTISHGAVEYRPVFQVFSVPVAPPEKDFYYHPLQRLYQENYPKPVKTHTKEYARRQKQGKIPNSQVFYKHTSYNTPDKYDKSKIAIESKKIYPKTQTYKYNADYTQHSKENGYDTEYYVPANSPIIGDIRRSLLDYTGARDIMADEPDYLGSVGLRRFKTLEIQRDYYPFRRSDTNVKDLEMHESKRN